MKPTYILLITLCFLIAPSAKADTFKAEKAYCIAMANYKFARVGTLYQKHSYGSEIAEIGARMVSTTNLNEGTTCRRHLPGVNVS